jgi:hypothetical protein
MSLPKKKLSIYLFPKTKQIQDTVQNQKLNPHVCFTVKYSKSISFVVKHLETKWNSFLNGRSVKIFPKAVNFATGQHPGWSTSDDKILLSEISENNEKVELEYSIISKQDLKTNSPSFAMPMVSSNHNNSSMAPQLKTPVKNQLLSATLNTQEDSNDIFNSLWLKSEDERSLSLSFLNSPAPVALKRKFQEMEDEKSKKKKIQ